MKQSNISIVLVKTLYPGNIGSVVRAMKNMGFESLILVNPCDFRDHEETKKMSIGDQSILKKVKVCHDLKSALSPFQWTVATTRRRRRRFSQFLSPEDVAQKMGSLPRPKKAALVFGSEDKGLSNRDMALCQAVSTIDSSPSHPSLNLAQAVMLYLYQIYQSKSHRPRNTSETDLAGVREMEGMYQHLYILLEELRYFNRGRPETLMESIRNFLNRAQLGHRDVRILRGIFSSVRRKIRRLED